APAPEEAAKAALQAANAAVVQDAAEFQEIVKMLAGKDRALYESSVAEKEANNKILLSALVDSASCYASANQPEAAVPKYKAAAIKLYEMAVKTFPNASEYMPRVLLQLGTLWSTIPAEDAAAAEANAKKATEYFDKLSSDYPESDEARNALYRQGKALLDLGYRAQGLAKFREMISAPGGKYTALQLASAAQEIAAAKDWDLAEQGYAAALAKADPSDTSLRARISLGRARALVSRESWAEARAALEEYIRENPRSASVVEAYELLCKSCVQASLSEDSAEARNNLFASAVKAVTAMRPYKNGPAEALDLQLQIGSVMQAQATVEAEKGDKATAEDLLRKAAGHYMKLVMSADFTDAALRPGLQKVYVRAIRTLAATKKYNDGSPVWDTVKELCETYMEKFPQGEEILEVRKALSDANIAMATGG
ncbi:MAG: hypothetical protein IJ678_01880, partial [Kiritimatiellae bacterium]|nr:hypothetical protein [Kiritimatiellia bacterium]